ncbi:MAG: response regulator [Gemmatimonadetes bacterium]|nr:response regulator [Gemmatimonadota bacterium]
MTQTSERPEPWSILLAEDNEDHALLIRMALERASQGPIELAWVRDGDAALRAAEERPPDLLLLDLNMPGRSGHDVLERLKGDERLRRIPVAVLTSSDRDEDIARSYGLGTNHFITKPENPADLERRLRSLLEQLPQLGAVRRGTGRMAVTAVSDIGPSLLSPRSQLVWGILLALVAGFVIYLIYLVLGGG